MGVLAFVSLLSCFVCVDLEAVDPWWLRVAQRQGPMVCAEEHIDGINRVFSTPWTKGNLCGFESIVHYSCCPGYGTSVGERGCPLVKPLKNLVETAMDIGAKQFIKHAEQSGILPLLSKSGAYTVFIAKDKAFKKLTKEQEKQLNSTKKSRSRTPALLYTLVDGRMTAEKLTDFLPTLYREGSATVTRHPSGLISINCIPLIATNIEATNGIIHVTESLLLPTGRSSVTDLLTRTATLSTTAAMLTRAQLSNELRDKKKFTFFAPTNEAWEALPPYFLESIMEDVNSVKVLLQFHIVDSEWCSAITSGKATLLTLEGSTLETSCNSSGNYISGAQIVQGDFTARNGFLHQINEVLIPDRARSLVDFLEKRNLTLFLKLLEFSGMLPILKRQDIYTVFAPINEAFEDASNETISSLFSEPVFARSVISFHIASGRQLTTNVIDGQTVVTMKGPESFLRLKIHKKRMTVETAFITETDLQARNGLLHVIDKILLPPSSSLLNLLKNGNFSIFVKLLNQTEPNLLEILGDASSTLTLFAPSDSYLNQTMPPGMFQRLMSDPPVLNKTMAYHILPTFVVTSSLEPLLTYSYKTITNEDITVTRESDGTITVANLAEITVRDVPATNGVLHEISRLIQF